MDFLVREFARELETNAAKAIEPYVERPDTMPGHVLEAVLGLRQRLVFDRKKPPWPIACPLDNLLLRITRAFSWGAPAQKVDLDKCATRLSAEGLLWVPYRVTSSPRLFQAAIAATQGDKAKLGRLLQQKRLFASRTPEAWVKAFELGCSSEEEAGFFNRDGRGLPQWPPFVQIMPAPQMPLDQKMHQRWLAAEARWIQCRLPDNPDECLSLVNFKYRITPPVPRPAVSNNPPMPKKRARSRAIVIDDEDEEEEPEVKRQPSPTAAAKRSRSTEPGPAPRKKKPASSATKPPPPIRDPCIYVPFEVALASIGGRGMKFTWVSDGWVRMIRQQWHRLVVASVLQETPKDLDNRIGFFDQPRLGAIVVKSLEKKMPAPDVVARQLDPEAMPPCMRKIHDQATHPKFHQRMLYFSVLATAFGFKAPAMLALVVQRCKKDYGRTRFEQEWKGVQGTAEWAADNKPKLSCTKIRQQHGLCPIPDIEDCARSCGSLLLRSPVDFVNARFVQQKQD
jgi:hypothetical protein